MRPRDKVIELLRTLDEVRQTYNSGSGGGGVTMMPSDYSLHSYPELERCLVGMRDTHRTERWHLMHRYVWGDNHKRLIVHSRKTIKGRVPVLPPRAELRIQGETLDKGLMVVWCYTWAEEVDPVLVTAGVDRLTALMYGGQWWRLTLPKPFLERLDHGEPRAGHIQGAPLTAT